MFIVQSHVQFLIQIFHTSITPEQNGTLLVTCGLRCEFCFPWAMTSECCEGELLFLLQTAKFGSFFFFSLNSNPPGSPSPLTHPWFGYQLRQAVTIVHKVGFD